MIYVSLPRGRKLIREINWHRRYDRVSMLSNER